MTTLTRMTLPAALACLLLAACAPKPVTRTTSTTTPATSRTTTTTTTPAGKTGSTSRRQRTTASGATAGEAGLPERTGVAACDDYLSSYLSCHRAAAIYAPDQLQYRYDAMRTSLLRDSQNPDIRPQLGARCNSLATQLRQALHGKSCAESPAPAPASTTP